MKINLFWFRRDLRLIDNTALSEALKEENVKPIFIFDSEILNNLEKDDARLSFIHSLLTSINTTLKKHQSGVFCYHGSPEVIWSQLVSNHDIDTVFWNKDYEPYAIQRDDKIKKLLSEQNIKVKTFKDQVIFEEFEVLKDDKTPYTVFTPYKNKWLSALDAINKNNGLNVNTQLEFNNFIKESVDMPSLNDLGFRESQIIVKSFNFS